MSQEGGVRLLVPVALEALVVNQSDRYNTLWSVSQRQFNGLEGHAPIEPPPFVRGNDRPRIGVTLHWALPDALTRGTPSGTGLSFPKIPNRWLVARTARHETGERVNSGEPMKAWIVESDFLGPEGSNLFPDPADAQGWTRIGRSWPLADWPAANETDRLFLTALGPGDDPSFAAYVGNVDNVLSFYDDLSDLELVDATADKDDPAELSYMVVGWYSDTAFDPLHGGPGNEGNWQTVAEWRQVMGSLGWSVGDELDLSAALADAAGGEGADTDVSAYPSSTVYHGMVYGVRWTGVYGPAQPYNRGADSPFAGAPITSRADWRNPDYGSTHEATAGAAWADAPALTPDGHRAGGQGLKQRPSFPHVAIGNSTVDALAAMVEYLAGAEEGEDGSGLDISTFLQAIEYDLLDLYDQPGGQVELREKIHAEWFVPSAGGSSWEVVASRGDAFADMSSASRPGELAVSPVDVSSVLDDLGLQGDLETLNDEQRGLDERRRSLAAKQRQLYVLWWKVQRLELAPAALAAVEGIESRVVLPEWKTRLQELRVQVETEVSELEGVEGARSRVQEQVDRLSSRLSAARLPDGGESRLKLIERPAPRFFRPADPVVLVYGARRSHKHGWDGRWTGDGTLLCRFTGQTIRALHVASVRVDAAESDLRNVLGLSALEDEAKPIPGIAWDLLAELVLLDPGCAGWIVEIGGGNENDENLTALVRARQRLIWGDYHEEGVSVAALVAQAGFAGVRPSPLAVESWVQPWSPLFLCWRVTWYPTPSSGGSDVSYWKFDGSDYAWDGVGTFDSTNSVTLQGRSLLTATSTRALQEGIDSLFEVAGGDNLEPAESAALAAMQSRIENADLLSQPLTGFHDQLLQQDPSHYVNPADPTLTELLGDVDRSAPMPFRNGAASSHFYPVRAGHFRLERLWIVDAYGQVFDPIHERGQTRASFTPLRGSGLVTLGLSQRTDTQMLQLPPRIVQSCRLQFRFLSADEDVTRETGVDARSSPVCGWLLPNHFDKSLTVYDPEGHALGAVLLAGGGAENRRVRWEPAIGGDRSVASIEDIANQHVRLMVAGLLGRKDGARAFEDLIEVIDRTLWTVDALGQRGDNLSVMIGRPIAVVRAKVGLELAGAPATDQLWEKTGQGDTRGFTELKFPLELGHTALRRDGTLGYFAAAGEDPDPEDYARFRAVHDLVPDSGYVIRQAEDRISVGPTSSVSEGLSGAGSDDDAVFLTLLMDPRGSVHVRSGLLPTKEIQLPRRFVEPAVERMDVTFRVGPILNEARGLRMPLPAEIRGGWSWIQKSGVAMFSDEVTEIEAATHHARLGGTPVSVREGWLKLSTALGRSDSETRDPGSS